MEVDGAVVSKGVEGRARQGSGMAGDDAATGGWIRSLKGGEQAHTLSHIPYTRTFNTQTHTQGAFPKDGVARSKWEERKERC